MDKDYSNPLNWDKQTWKEVLPGGFLCIISLALAYFVLNIFY